MIIVHSYTKIRTLDCLRTCQIWDPGRFSLLDRASSLNEFEFDS